MGTEGEGGLGVELGIAMWEPHTFSDFEVASVFFNANKEKTDGHIHPNDDYGSFVIFTRKENE